MNVEQLLKRHTKNFTAPTIYEGKLEGIHYHSNGSVYVTNSHTLLALHDVHNEESKTVHFKTGKNMNVDYPDISRLLQTDYDNGHVISFKNIEPYIELIKVSKFIDKVADLIIENGQLLFKVHFNNESFTLPLVNISKNDYQINTIGSLNVMYFYHMMKFFKDANVDELELMYKNKFSPFSFRAGKYEILILPVKR